MSMRDEDFGSALTLTEADGSLWPPPMAAPVSASADRPSLYEQALARADAAEARSEELRWAEVAARSDAAAWKSRFKACRQRLSEAEEEAKGLRRTARDVPSLLAEVARLEELLSEARNGSSRLRTEAQELRAEARELRAGRSALASRVETLEAQLDKLRSSRAVLSKAAFGSKSERQKKPGTGRKRGPSSRRTPNRAIRRRMRASVRVAASPMSPTASVWRR